MKKINITLLVLLITSISFAQKPQQGKRKVDKEKIEAMKIAFITNKLALTPKEAQVFWPVYNEYNAKREALRKQIRTIDKKTKGEATEPSDEEVAKKIAQHFKLRQEELNLDKAYHEKFIKVLPIKKVGKLYRAQHDFKRELLKKIRNHKGNGGHSDPSPHH